MSTVSGALRTEQTHDGGTRTIAGIVNSFKTLEDEDFLVRRPFLRGRTERDPLEEARKRVRAQRRVSAQIPTLGEPGEARRDGETTLPEDPKLVNS
jgi:hypothetical protein